MPVFYATFLHYEGWIGPGTAWANEAKILWNLPQSIIEPATFYSFIMRHVYISPTVTYLLSPHYMCSVPASASSPTYFCNLSDVYHYNVYIYTLIRERSEQIQAMVILLSLMRPYCLYTGLQLYYVHTAFALAYRDLVVTDESILPLQCSV